MLAQQISPNPFFGLLSAVQVAMADWPNGNSDGAAIQAEAPKEAAAAAALCVRHVGAVENICRFIKKSVI